MSNAHKVTLTRLIQASPSAVWEVITDLHSAQDRLSQVTELHVVTDGPYALGTRWRETRTTMGSTQTQEMQVVENDPGRRTVLEARDGKAAFRTELTLEPTGEGTDLTLRFSGEPTDPGLLQKLAMKVMGPLATRMTEKSLATELDDIAAAAEGFPSP